MASEFLFALYVVPDLLSFCLAGLNATAAKMRYAYRKGGFTMDIGAPELILILVIVVILFGGGRVAKLGGELGQGLREFRKGLAGTDETKPAVTQPTEPVTKP
jgi:sec-independent protein translocase protein TatA